MDDDVMNLIEIKKKAIIFTTSRDLNLNKDVPGQFLPLNGKPILYYTLNTFLNTFKDLEIILVLPEEYIALGSEIIDGYFDSERITICPGGDTRFDSVKKGIAHLGNEDSIVFVHDGLRCLLSSDLIVRCYQAALENNTAIPVMGSSSNIILPGEDGNKVLGGNEIKLAQSPQTFHSKILKTAFDIDYKPHFTDAAAVAEAFGINLKLIEGEEMNFAVNTSFNVKVAEMVLEMN